MLKEFVELCIQENTKNLHEVSEETYSKITPNMRVHMTSHPEPKIPSGQQRVGFKPVGLWYGLGTEWIDWVREEMPEWESENVFEIKIDESRILKIDSEAGIRDLTREFGLSYRSPSGGVYDIDWPRIAKLYSGIEISPYQRGMRYDKVASWYYTWDIASGCIWGNDVIKKMQKI